MIVNPSVIHGEDGRVWDLFGLNLSHGNIILTGEINDELATMIVSQLRYYEHEKGNDKAPVTLYINSPGGSVSAGLAIYDTMKSLTRDVQTICLGRAASMAAVILSGGTRGMRYVLPHSQVMIHQPSGGIDGQASDILIAAKHIEETRRELNSILAANCGHSYEEIALATERDNWMNAESAVEFGIADKILGGN